MTPAARRLLLRDVLITAACGCLWWLVLGTSESTGVVGTVLSILAGLSTGLVSFLVHEWGHAIGSKLSGATIYFADRITSWALFFFDTEKSDKHQFLAMSYGGYIASALAMVAAFAFLPRDELAGQIGLAVVAIGIVATLIGELPTTIRVARGGPMPQGHVYRSGGV